MDDFLIPNRMVGLDSVADLYGLGLERWLELIGSFLYVGDFRDQTVWSIQTVWPTFTGSD